MEGVGSKIRPVRPNDGSELRIDSHLGEVLRIPEWLEDRADNASQLGCEVDLVHQSVGESEPQTEPTQVFDLTDFVGSAQPGFRSSARS